MQIQKHHYFYLFVIALFLLISGVNLFSDGMFIDGLFYAVISRNMAEGLGTFWKPHFTDFVFNEFYEHPPLALGLESILFYIFGDSIFVERLYSLGTQIVIGTFVVLIWKELTSSTRNGWIPLFIWIITSYVSWGAENNMLENTMGVFIYLSILLYFKSTARRQNYIYLIFTGLSLTAALLSKGFVCLYVWTIPFFFWAFGYKIKKFSRVIKDTLFIVLFTITPLFLLYYLSAEAQNNFITYFNKQVIGSIENIQTVNNRLSIVAYFFKNTIIPWIIGLILFIVLYKKGKLSLLMENQKTSLALFLVVLSGVFPIMISLKQRGFYILTVYPLFALSWAYFFNPFLEPLLHKFQNKSKVFKSFKITTVIVLLLGIILSVGQINRVGRDRQLIKDTKLIISIVGIDEHIYIHEEMKDNWSLHGYFARYGNVSLNSNTTEDDSDYYLTYKNHQPRKNYEKVDIITDRLVLYKK